MNTRRKAAPAPPNRYRNRRIVLTKTTAIDDKGITLIELITAIAIASIVAGIVASIMLASANSYKKEMAESSVQTYAQIVMDQIEDLVIDTKGRADYGYMDAPDDIEWGQVRDMDDEEPAYGKKLRLYGTYTGLMTRSQICDIEWRADAGELWYIEHDSTDGEDPIEGSSTSEMLADGVTAFSCDLTTVSSDRALGVGFTIEKGRRQYRAHKNISIRNPIDAPSASISDDQAIELVVTSDTIVVEPNMEMPMYGARVKGTTESAAVIYEIPDGEDGPTSDRTRIDDGKTLRIGADESAESFKVIARAAADDAKRGKITVYVRRVNAIESLSADCGAQGAKPGDTVTVRSRVSIQAEPGISRKDGRALHSFTFTVPGAADLTVGDGSCTFRIPESAQEGKTYTVTMEAQHPHGGGDAMTEGYFDPALHRRTETIQVIEPGSTVPVVLNKVSAYRGQQDVMLSIDPYTSMPASGWTSKFYYRKEKDEPWGFTADEADAMRGDWIEIPSHSRKSFALPEELTAGLGIDEEGTYQFAAVAIIRGKYRLCGRGEFRVPALKLQIDEEEGNGRTYRVFKLRKDGQAPAGDAAPIRIGQTEKAFARVRYKGTGSQDKDHCDLLLENIDEEKILTYKSGKLSTADGDMSMTLKLTDLSYAGISYPTYAGSVKDGGKCTGDGTELKEHYDRARGHKKKFRIGVSRASYTGAVPDKEYGAQGPYLTVEARIGNAVLQVERSDKNGKWHEDWIAFIPPPGSEGDLLNSYSLAQLSSTYRPAGSTQGVNIATVKADGKEYSAASASNRYLIQMKASNGSRYIRLWTPKNVKELPGGRFTGDPDVFIGEYRYDEDDEMWGRTSTQAPTHY